MRAYGHGDPMRHVLWKTFARSRRLLVRMPERAIAPSPTTVAFLIAGPGEGDPIAARFDPLLAEARALLQGCRAIGRRRGAGAQGQGGD